MAVQSAEAEAVSSSPGSGVGSELKGRSVIARLSVLGAEAFNTAIEELAKAVGTYPDDGIRDALDVASGGVLVAVTTAVVVGLVLFVPKLLAIAGWS